jgi:hypothetical protein
MQVIPLQTSLEARTMNQHTQLLCLRTGLPDFSWYMIPKQAKVPDGHKISQITINYINIFPSKALQNLPKLKFLVWKETIWQPCLRMKFQNQCCQIFLSTINQSVCHSAAALLQNRRTKELFEGFGFCVSDLTAASSLVFSSSLCDRIVLKWVGQRWPIVVSRDNDFSCSSCRTWGGVNVLV